jgi:nitrile hydratase
MNSVHDLGGMMGFGPVRPEHDEPLFHADWEPRALALTLACGALGEWSIDTSRHARESLHPVFYLSASYYEIWIEALTCLLEQRGMLSAEERSAGRALAPAISTRRPPPTARDIPAIIARGGPCDRPVSHAPIFSVGDPVRTRNLHPVGHTRLPRYARDKSGIVERVQGSFVLPDSNAHGGGENPQWVYCVTFSGTELWGGQADPGLSVSIDCWESYLDHG